MNFTNHKCDALTEPLLEVNNRGGGGSFSLWQCDKNRNKKAAVINVLLGFHI